MTQITDTKPTGLFVRLFVLQASTRAQATVDAESALETAQKTETQKQAEIWQ